MSEAVFRRAIHAGTFVLGCATALAQQPAPAGNVIGVGNFSHIVANLDRSVRFYRDVIGLDVAGSTRTFSGEVAMRAGNTPGARSLFTTLPVPGSALGVEIIEYQDIERSPADPRLQDPGAAILALTVRDLDSVLKRAKAAGIPFSSQRGLPTTHSDGGRVVVVRDPDGFFVELFQPARTPQTLAPPSSNVVDSSFALTVGRADRTIRLLKEVLGFESPVGATSSDQALVDAIGPPGLQLRESRVMIPGSYVALSLLEFRGPAPAARRTRLQDPGTPVLQLRVRGIETLTSAWKAAGGEVVSTDGEPADLGAIKIVVFREPNNLMLELIEAVAR